MARETYDTGVSICRPLYYNYPDVDEAYAYEGEYMFGDDILVAPITEAASNGVSTKEIWFPGGNWWSVATNELIEGPCVKTMSFTQEQIPYFFKQGALIPFNPATVKNVTDRPDELIVNVVSGANGVGSIYEDDGNNSDYDGNYATTKLLGNSNGITDEYVIMPREIIGSVSGLKDARSYIFNVYNCKAPESIAISGTVINSDAYRYTPETKTLVVNVPKHSCGDEIRISVRH